MKNFRNLILSILITSAAQAQYAVLCPLDLTGYNAIPLYISAPQHDVMWAATYGYNGGQTNSKTFIKTTDAGASFSIGTVPELEDRGTTCIFARNSDTAWVGMYDINGTALNSIWKTSDGGANWLQQSSTEFSYNASNLTAICFFSADSGVAVGGPVGNALEIYTTSDGGTSWSRVSSSNIPSSTSGEYTYFNQYSHIGNSIWIPTGLGNVFYSNDKGYNWQVTSVGGGTNEVSMNDGNNGAIADRTHTIYYTTNGGLSWISRTPSPGLNVYNIGAIPNYAGCFIFRSDLGIFATVDFFQTYFLIDNATPINTDPIQMYDATIGWSDAGEFSADSMIVKIADVLAGAFSPEANSNLLTVFPNPIAHGSAMISYQSKRDETTNISIIDLSGKIIRTIQHESTAGTNALRFDVNGISAGLYLLELRSGDFASRRSIVITSEVH